MSVARSLVATRTLQLDVTRTVAEFFQAKGQPLIPTNLKNKRQEFVKTLSFTWIQDGLRHTFCTFHYAKHKNIELLRHVMGNSPAVIDRFYKGAVNKAEVEEFWNIVPKAGDEQVEASVQQKGLGTSGR